MPPRPAVLTKRTLDKDLDKITHAEDAAKHVCGGWCRLVSG